MNLTKAQKADCAKLGKGARAGYDKLRANGRDHQQALDRAQAPARVASGVR
jgi:hypothetical protein